MKKFFLLFLLFTCHVQIFAQDISGTWSSRLTNEPNLSVSVAKNSQGIYLLSVSYNGYVASFIESKREQEVISNQEIEHNILFDCSGNNKPELFKEGLILTYYSRANGDIPNEINIGCRDFQYRYERWNLFRIQEKSYTTNNSYSSSNNKSSNVTLNNNNITQEERVPNITATFGLNGEWVFELRSNGSFSHHKFEIGLYGRKTKEISITHGSYKIMKDDYGRRIVYFYYENGNVKKALLKYERDRAILSYPFPAGISTRYTEMN